MLVFMVTHFNYLIKYKKIVILVTHILNQKQMLQINQFKENRAVQLQMTPNHTLIIFIKVS